MTTRSFSKSSIASCNRHLSKSKHWNAESWNIYAFTSCSSKQVTESDYITQLSQRQNARNSMSMQDYTCSSDKN